MTLPVPGDFAVIIQDAPRNPSQSNVGKKVFVESFNSSSSLLEMFMEKFHGQLVVVTTLEPFWVTIDFPGAERDLVSPSGGVITPRSYLRKIEPLCAPEANYEADKTGEAEAFARDLDRALDKLVEVLTNP